MFYRTFILFFGMFVICGCSKKDVPTKVEDVVKFSTTPDNSNGIISVTSDTLNLAVNITSKIPDDGFTVSVELIQLDNSLSIIKTEKSTTVNPVNFKVYPLQIGKAYSVKVIVTSKNTVTNTSTALLTVKRNRVYKNYLKTSYELSNYDSWFSSSDLFNNNGSKYLNNPLMDMQFCQLDIDGDGLEDLFYYEGYDLRVNPTPNPPPSVFMNIDKTLKLIPWTGPSIKDPHGDKLLIGDFNNDSIPDIFSLVAVDQPIGVTGIPKNNCHLLFNSSSGFKTVKEFDDQLGYWYSGCSGDIDNDGDLDIIMFNFAYDFNFVTSKILWNDGKGNFTYDPNGIGNISLVEQSELVDVNNDGYLDLVINYGTFNYTTLPPVKESKLVVMWGNGKGFGLANSTVFLMETTKHPMDLDFVDIDNDGFKEIIVSGTDDVALTYYIDMYKSDDKGKTFIKKTDQYFDVTHCSRFGHMIVNDIDKNGRIDIYSTDKKDNIRWEWNGNKFIKQ